MVRVSGISPRQSPKTSAQAGLRKPADLPMARSVSAASRATGMPKWKLREKSTTRGQDAMRIAASTPARREATVAPSA